MGINPEIIVAGGETTSIINKSGSEDYSAWKINGRIDSESSYDIPVSEFIQKNLQ